MSEVSIHVRFVPGEPTPPPVPEDAFNSAEGVAAYRAHLLHALEHYPTTTSVTVEGLTFTEVFEIMRDVGVTMPKARAREFLRLLCEKS